MHALVKGSKSVLSLVGGPPGKVDKNTQVSLRCVTAGQRVSLRVSLRLSLRVSVCLRVSLRVSVCLCVCHCG
jgi:hypothetical protein